MNGGKDVKIGHDKRPVSVVPSDEQPLYNIANGRILTDEFGNPLVTKVDQFFLNDVSKDRSTSVVFPSIPQEKENKRIFRTVGIATGTYGVNFDAHVVITNVGFTTYALLVKEVDGSFVGVGTTTPNRVSIATTSGSIVTLPNFPNSVEVRTIANLGGDYNHIYFYGDEIEKIQNVTIPTKITKNEQYVIKVSGGGIPHGTAVTKRDYDRITLSNNVVVSSGSTSERVEFTKVQESVSVDVDNVLKIAEQFIETSEVSSTLLGIDRAETQLSLFSNVSSYGLNKDEWEAFTYTDGVSFRSWDRRINRTYGSRFLTKIDEITKESAITVESFPPSHSYPFGPKFNKIGIYNPTLYPKYLDFIRLGNALYELYKDKLSGYGQSWIEKFLNESDVRPEGSGNAVEVYYKKTDSTSKPAEDYTPVTGGNFDYAFSKIDTWTDTYRDIVSEKLTDPITGELVNFTNLMILLGNNGLPNNFSQDDTIPGYQTTYRRYVTLQSRRVFRYQPGRISGFTFGSRASNEPVGGMANEWGIVNKTDQYMFRIYAGQLSIIRRSTVRLSDDVLIRNGLNPTDSVLIGKRRSTGTVQPLIPNEDPFDDQEYWTVEIPRDNFNGDSLNGNGPSGYSVLTENVTMWKIEFGWYGAIGARFYAYIPTGNGDARWVVVHTLIIENSLGQPCLQDSYFRFKYVVSVFDTGGIRTPQYIYKYGASYYIDGGDEGTSEQFSTSTGLQPKQINRTSEAALIGIRPKDVILSSSGVEIPNRKLVLPTKLSISSDSLAEVKVKTCTACPGYGHVFTPGVGTTISGRTMNIKFDDGNTISAVGAGASFTAADIGAKIIAPSIFNAYITEMDETGSTITYDSGLKTYNSAKVYGWGPGLDGYPKYASGRQIAGDNAVIDYGSENPNGTRGVRVPVGQPETTLDGVQIYKHQIRLSNYDVHFASDYPIYGSKIELQFVNPQPKDGISSYRNATHWADFMVGLTDKKPTISGNTLNGWDASIVPWVDYNNASNNYVGQGNTTILPENEILFGEATHTWAGMNEDGFEYGEAWAPTGIRTRMGIDSRIPTVPSPAGGRCCRAIFEVAPPVVIGANVKQLYQKNPETEQDDAAEGTYLKIIGGSFTSSITDWVGGQVVNKDPETGILNTSSTILFEKTNKPSGSTITYAQEDPNKPFAYIDSEGKRIEYIKISNPIVDTENTGIFDVMGRPITLTAERLNETKVKLFRYEVFPLYFVGKLMDNAQINNISIKETIGDNQKTTAPTLGITRPPFGFIDNAGGNAAIDGTPPTNYKSVKRLSSAAIDTQNQQKLREETTVTKDTFYVGKNSTKQIDMTKVFGTDRNVITPDNLNLEATFLTAKKLDGDNVNNTGNIQLTLNYKEQ
jgi:hypothetical protein